MVSDRCTREPASPTPNRFLLGTACSSRGNMAKYSPQTEPILWGSVGAVIVSSSRLAGVVGKGESVSVWLGHWWPSLLMLFIPSFLFEPAGVEFLIPSSSNSPAFWVTSFCAELLVFENPIWDYCRAISSAFSGSYKPTKQEHDDVKNRISLWLYDF